MLDQLHRMDDHAHLVEFYETDEFLADSVRDYLLPALRQGDAGIVVATPDHERLFCSGLADAGIDVEAAKATGQLVMLDAAETLARFMVDGEPDGTRFRTVIGGLIAGAAAGPRGVRVYGEMVALLWANGEVAAAITLEDLWNDLSQTHPFSLFCAYPLRAFDRDSSTAGFRRVCQQHSKVIPSERFSKVADPGEQMRAVAALQQEAGAGAAERAALQAKQRELEAALAQLTELDRLRNQFVAMVVHDIRTPTSIISGFLELLRANWSRLDERQIGEFLERGITSTRQIERLVEDMLTVSRLQSGEFSFEIGPLDLRETVYRAVAAVRAALPSGRFEVSVPPDLPTAWGDGERQVQVLNNLLTNAVKYSGDDTTVTVTVRLADGDLIVSVADHGPGLTDDEIGRLFRPFSRLENRSRPAVNGTGLGLYIARALVEGQGGRIWVDSTPGAGSTFSYTVPVAR